MNYIISLIVGYFIGCFQTGFIIGKYKKHIDIRQHGSGNAGTTNAIRVMGWKAGLCTFLGDFFKAFIVVFIVHSMYNDSTLDLVAGLGVVLGHNFPVFLKFNGGKGIASTVGTMMAFDYRIGLIAMLIMIIIVLITRYVSLGSLLLATWIPIGIYLFKGKQWEMISLGVVFMLLACYRHKSNIVRLINGKENKFGKKATA